MFSEKIRQLRKDRHLTQAEVAKEVLKLGMYIGFTGAIRTWSWAPSPGMTRCCTSRTSTACPQTG